MDFGGIGITPQAYAEKASRRRKKFNNCAANQELIHGDGQCGGGYFASARSTCSAFASKIACHSGATSESQSSCA